MALPLNRTGIFLDLMAFLGFSIFCISTEAPLIQQDILKRCQDALLMDHISIRGLSVDGRDVILSGPADSALMSARARLSLEGLAGVRTIRTEPISAAGNAEMDRLDDNRIAEPPTKSQQSEAQNRIDTILQNEALGFKADTATLTPESERSLDKIAAILSSSPNLLCDIRAYDSHPRDAHKTWVLALQRALATEDYLVAKGIAEWRLSTQALQTGERSDGRRTDRIVDLVVRVR
jgi:outer membrane protein OmpA-like peptidoglycan-associated protein